jgi:hypothetical protein
VDDLAAGANVSAMESVEQVGRAYRAFASAYDALLGAFLEPGRLVDRNQDLVGARGFIACETVCCRPGKLAVGLVLGPAHLVVLPAVVDGTKGSATFKDGVLELVLPKFEKAKRRGIPIK